MISVMPGPTVVIISRRNLDNIGLNYRNFQKTIDKLYDGLTEKIEMKSYLPLLLFLIIGF